MREIEGIEEVVDKLQPHREAIQDRFEEENRQFKEMIERDHDAIGRVLKCHLVVEHYLDRFLQAQYEIDDLGSAGLRFYQKAKLLPNEDSAAAFVKPGIVRLNAIRNMFGHNLEADVDIDDLDSINRVVDAVPIGLQNGSAVERIEAFTTIACTFLIVPPPALQDVFMEAFSEVEIHAR